MKQHTTPNNTNKLTLTIGNLGSPGPENWVCTCMYMYTGYYVCRYNDPPYVKMKKVELLTELCNVENAESIVNELG